MFWNVTAARLAFIVVFEHLIFFIIYVMQWLVPDVPKSVQDKITYERFIDQQGRWLNSSKPSEFENANVDARAVGKMEKRLDSQNRGNAIIKSPMKITGTTSNRRRNVKVRKVTVN